MSKKKILLLGDDLRATSGVGCQLRYLMTGLVQKGTWTVRQFGAALRHGNYEPASVHPDIIVKPIDGFGSPDLLRVTLAQEKPDAIVMMSDPRFYEWLFTGCEDVVHQVCPILWWNIWDARPTPVFNRPIYEATDTLNCISDLTYEMLIEMFPADKFPGKVNYIPHGLPKELFFPLSESARKGYKLSVLGKERENHFVCMWINRNAKRKRPNDVLESWKLFLDRLESECGHKNATLIMHTDPRDNEGPNLIYTAEALGISKDVVFSPDRLDFDKINILHNISDCCLNISFAEGFGLGTLESMYAGNPIIAIKTGGMTRQVINHNDGSENGIALPVEIRSLVGSQGVPMIYEDLVSNKTTADALFRMSQMSESDRRALGAKAREYALSEFNLDKIVDDWDASLNYTIKTWKERYKRWECKTI